MRSSDFSLSNFSRRSAKSRASTPATLGGGCGGSQSLISHWVLSPSASVPYFSPVPMSRMACSSGNFTASGMPRSQSVLGSPSSSKNRRRSTPHSVHQGSGSFQMFAPCDGRHHLSCSLRQKIQIAALSLVLRRGNNQGPRCRRGQWLGA